MARRKNMQRRREILDNTFRLIRIQGFDHVSLQMIAEKSGISKSLLQSYYPHKARLMSDIVRNLFNTMWDQVVVNDVLDAQFVQGRQDVLEVLLGFIVKVVADLWRVWQELLVFFSACLTGVNVRAGYEILIFLRKMIIHNNLVKGIEDLFYWIFMSAYIFSQIYATMYGSIRWYFLLGLVFGVAVIQKLISSGEKIHKKTRKNLEIIRKNR